MSNAPDRFALFVLGDDEKRLTIHEDARIPNAIEVVLNKQDHTMGNMLRHAVLAQPGVLFCGYKVPHPLEPKVMIRIQTDGKETPIEVLHNACDAILTQIMTVQSQFRTQAVAQLTAAGLPVHGAAAGTGQGGAQAGAQQGQVYQQVGWQAVGYAGHGAAGADGATFIDI